MSVVFGTNMTTEMEPLAELAALLASRLAAPMRLVHVSEDPRAPLVLGTDEEHVLGPVRARLELEAVRLRGLTGADVHPHLAAGPMVSTLASVAEFELATVLILGGGSVASRHPLGDTAERLARRSVVPVLALRDPGRLRSWLDGQRTLRVLVGADLGRASESARAFAATLGALGPSQVEVAFVVAPRDAHAQLGLPPLPDEHALAPEAEAALLRDLARSAPVGENATLRLLPARGGADAHLVALADEGGFDVVVVGQRRHSILEQLWYGSVARGVLRAAPVSVVCVPPPLGARPAAYRAPRVALVGVDFLEAGERALEQGLGHVATGGTVHLVHVLAPAGTASDAREAREQAWYALAKMAPAEGDPRGVNIERHVLEGAAPEELLSFADRVGAELIVLGARSRPALSRALLGSVARSVSDRAQVPVLLVPQGAA